VSGNPNHDAKTGEFSSGDGGGGSRQHPDAAANAHDVQASLASSVPGGPKWGTNGAANTRMAQAYIESQGIKAEVYRNAKSSYMASYSPSMDKISINASNSFWKDPAGNTQRLADKGILSSGDANHALNHEIAHAIYDPPDNFMTLSHQEAARSEVSKYAAGNPKEFVSEVYAGMKAGKVYSPEINRMFQQYAKPGPHYK
jgi:hypothetical protein